MTWLQMMFAGRRWRLAAVVVTVLIIWVVMAAPAGANECEDRYEGLAESVERERLAARELGLPSEGFKERCSRLDWLGDVARVEVLAIVIATGFFTLGLGFLGIAWGLESVFGRQTGEARVWAMTTFAGLALACLAGVLVKLVFSTLLGVGDFSATTISPLGG